MPLLGAGSSWLTENIEEASRSTFGDADPLLFSGQSSEPELLDEVGRVVSLSLGSRHGDNLQRDDSDIFGRSLLEFPLQVELYVAFFPHAVDVLLPSMPC